MELNQIKDAIQELTDKELADLHFWLPTEDKRRRDKNRKDEVTAKVIEDLRINGEISSPTNVTVDDISETTKSGDIDEWVNPGTIHSKMYTKGQIVRHNGKIWESKTPFLNSWEPGAKDVHGNVWKEVYLAKARNKNNKKDEKPAGKEYKKWTVGESYTTGDVVKFHGKLYEVQQPTVAQDHFRPDAAGMTALYVRI